MHNPNLRPMETRIRRSLAAAAALAVLFPCCSPAKKPQNMILITLDTLRSDHVSCYTPRNARTPAMDSLAAQGILFENSYCLIPITLPSHASIFFSQPPHAVKNYNNGQVIQKLRNRPSFVNLFRKEGFDTAAMVSLGVVGETFGLDEGFLEYQDDFPEGRWYLSAEEVNHNVLPWIRAHKDRRFFLWIHYSDPHDPYAPPDTPNDLKLYFNDKPIGEYCLSKYITYDIDLKLRQGKNQVRFETANPYSDNPEQFQARLDLLTVAPPAGETDVAVERSWGWFTRRGDNVAFLKNRATLDITAREAGPVRLTFRGKLLMPLETVRGLYRREVEYMDGQIGRLFETLRELGLFGNTAILMAGDHGEGLGDYISGFGDPHIGHIHYLYDVYMRVPLIIYSPGLAKKGVRRSEPVTLLDVAPTITRIMGLDRLPSFKGRDLLGLKKGAETAVFQETYKPESYEDRFGLLKGPWHMIYSPRNNHYELFNREDDPGEKENQYGDILSETAVALRKQLDDFVRGALKGKVDIKVDDRTEEMLKSLGYIKN